MEEILEQLKSLSEQVAFPLELPTADDLVEVEEEILISIPYDLRTYLLEASDVIYGSLELATVADPRAHTYLPEMAAVAWDIGVPREYIPFCEYAGGYVCIAQDGKVYLCMQEDIKEEWEDFWQWCREVWLQQEY